MVQLADVTRLAGNEQDANTWAYYAARAFATLTMDGEARHKRRMVESMETLQRNYPLLSRGKASDFTGVPDFTSGRLLYPQKSDTAATRIRLQGR
jgi:hypothetical protein